MEGVGARIPGGLIAARPGLDGASGRGGKHLVVRSGRRLNRIAHERHGLVDLGGAQVVRTVEREERGRGTLGNHVKQAPLGGGQRRIGRQHHQRTLRVADRRHRRGVVVLEDRLEPWGVHQRHARLQQLRRCRHKNPGDPLGVVGIVGLAHPCRQLGDGDGATGAVVQLDQGGRGPVTHLGGDRGHRQHADGQEVLADEGVDQRRLAIAEPAAHRNAKIAFAQALGQLVGTPFEHRIQLGCSFAKQPDRTQ